MAASATAEATSSSPAGQGIQCPAEPVVVQQGGGSAEPVVGGVGGGPVGHVVERAGGGEPVGDQGGDHLAVGEVGSAPHRAGPVRDAGRVQPVEQRERVRK